MVVEKNNIPIPAIKNVKQAIDDWNNDPLSKGMEVFLDNLFKKVCPSNTDCSDILVKIHALNMIYATRMSNEEKSVMVKHIAKLKIDDRLAKGDFSVVKDISKLKIGGKEKILYSFATKYCAFNDYKKYAIYDSNVDKVLWHFINKDKYIKIKRADLRDYNNFIEVLNKFRDFYHLEEFNFRELDHYLWLNGKKI